MTTPNLIILAIATVLIVAIAAFVLIVVLVIKHQQKMLKDFSTDNFNDIAKRLEE